MSKEELEEGVVGGLVFNSRRDEQWARRLSALGIPERDHDLFEEDEVAALEEATKPN